MAYCCHCSNLKDECKCERCSRSRDREGGPGGDALDVQSIIQAAVAQQAAKTDTTVKTAIEAAVEASDARWEGRIQGLITDEGKRTDAKIDKLRNELMGEIRKTVGGSLSNAEASASISAGAWGCIRRTVAAKVGAGQGLRAARVPAVGQVDPS